MVNLVLLLSLVVLVLASLGAFFVTAGEALRSKYRYELWRLRDEIVRAIFDGKLPEDPRIWTYIEHLEQTTRNLRDFTAQGSLPILVFSAQRIRRGESLGDDLHLSGEEGERLDNFRLRVGKVMLRNFLFGSPASWVLLPISLVLLWRLRLILRSKRRVARATPPSESVGVIYVSGSTILFEEQLAVAEIRGFEEAGTDSRELAGR